MIRWPDLHTQSKVSLRALLWGPLGVFKRADVAIFRLGHRELLTHVVDALQAREEMTEEERERVLNDFDRLHSGTAIITLGTGTRRNFEGFLRGQPPGPVVEILPSQIGAIRQEEPGFLKGLLYIGGVLFHVEFIRVKWKTLTPCSTSMDPEAPPSGQLPSYNEDGDGEQVPWDDDPASLCNTWWYQSMVHVDECAFRTITVPPFAGEYVVLIHPGSS